MQNNKQLQHWISLNMIMLLPQADKTEIKEANSSHISIVCKNFITNTFTIFFSSTFMKNNMYYWYTTIFLKEAFLLTDV
jgi:hypothetical protein